MNEKKPGWKLEIAPIELSEDEELMEVRSTQTHNLLAMICSQGVLLFDRKSRTQHLLTWENMQFPKSK